MNAGAALTETEIRPDELIAGQKACFAEDIRRLMARREEFVTVASAACTADAATERFHKFDMVFVECDVCGTVYANPRPTPELLEHYYAPSRNYAYFNEHIFPASEDARRKKLFRPRFQRLRELIDRHCAATGSLLEVGAGFGIFCEEVSAARLFERVIAVEPSPALAATCRQRGLKVVESPIENVAQNELAVDVVASFEVVEHLFCPRTFVQACAKFLAPGGLLVLTCPNGRGFDIGLLGPISDAVDVQHLNLFNPTSIAGLLEDCGFGVFGSDHSRPTRRRIGAQEGACGGVRPRRECVPPPCATRRLGCAGDALPMFLAANGLSSHMWAAARKPARA